MAAPVLVLRAPQVSALAIEVEERFLEDMVLHLRWHFAAETAKWSDAVLLERVREFVNRARAFEIETRRDLARYLGVVTVHELEPTAPLPPWMRAIVRDGSTPGASHRVDRLVHASLAKLRTEAKAMADRNAYDRGA